MPSAEPRATISARKPPGDMITTGEPVRAFRATSGSSIFMSAASVGRRCANAAVGPVRPSRSIASTSSGSFSQPCRLPPSMGLRTRPAPEKPAISFAVSPVHAPAPSPASVMPRSAAWSAISEQPPPEPDTPINRVSPFNCSARLSEASVHTAASVSIERTIGTPHSRIRAS